jgi:DNA-binding NtrC family response regulator
MQPGILFLDDDADLRRITSTLIQLKTGRTCLALATLDEVRTHREAVLASALAILDINLGEDQPSGLDAYGWLLAESYRGKVVFLTGHAKSHPLVEAAVRMGKVQVFAKPLSAEQLVELVKSAL